MKSKYFSFYLLSYFDFHRTTNVSQVLHVFHAKRTPSMFYRIEKNGWHSGFHLTANINREQLDGLVQYFLQNGWLEELEKGYRLTESGRMACNNYFSARYYPQHIQSFSHATIRSPFWNRLQLYSQVFSEMSYHNTTYIPVIKHPHHQENVRNLFQKFGQNKNDLLKQWVKEQSLLFHQLDRQMADVLVNQLTGHGQIGKTKEQIRMSLNMEALEFHFYLNDALELLIKRVKTQKDKMPLISAILNTLLVERNLGLSASTKQTYDLYKYGHTLEQIANIRKIKVNTVREHILEMAFVLENFPFKEFVPKDVALRLNKHFDENQDYTYRDAVADFGSIEFMYFRLVELERMRRNDGNN